MPTKGLVKYHREENARYDKQQMQFSIFGVIPNPLSYAKVIREYSIFDTEVVFCPFCLIQLQINKFLIKTKKMTIHQGLGLCPNCNNEMKLETLYYLLKMSMKEYAKWVFDYRLSGFWDKCPFEEWSKRLKQFCDYQDFWDTYKMLKGETVNTEDNY